MDVSRKSLATVLLLSLVGCGGPSVPAPPAPVAAPGSDPPFVGRIWVTATPGHARGSIIIFLPDRTLLMTSCTETYRLSNWQVTGDTIRWIEDTIPIQAVFSMPRNNELNLEIAGQERVQAYRAAPVPYVCPDMPK